MAKTKIALCYDFDGTLSPGNMQEYDFLKTIGMDVESFWNKSDQIMKAQHSDSVITYMKLMIEEAQRKGISLTRKVFKKCGEDLPVYPGVKTWFDRVNQYAKSKGLQIEHYIISSGVREMILGNDISKNFKHVYASSFMYNKKGQATWPAIAINYTTKTQYLFRINKGCLDINDPAINAFVPDDKREIPFSRIVYIGDGITDVPCMSLVKKEKGHSIAVFNPNSNKSVQAVQKLLKDDRVDFIAPSDYRAHKQLEKILFTIIDKVSLNLKIEALKEQSLTENKK